MGNELGWNFTADSYLQAELGKNMNMLAKQFDERIIELYNKIDSMGSEKHWVGEDYDAFKTGCEGYKNALQDLSNSFRMFANHLYKISDGTIDYANEINNIIANMTSRHIGNNTGYITEDNNVPTTGK